MQAPRRLWPERREHELHEALQLGRAPAICQIHDVCCSRRRRIARQYAHQAPADQVVSQQLLRLQHDASAANGCEPERVAIARNASAFPHATWILDRDELAWAEHEPSHFSITPALFAGYRSARTNMIEGDHDVFGDGRVRILHAPGHTPGSAVLWLDLHSPGPVILSGDLYTSRENLEHSYVPSINASRAETLASMARIERIAKRTHARIIVQHEPLDWAALPKPPLYLR